MEQELNRKEVEYTERISFATVNTEELRKRETKILELETRV